MNLYFVRMFCENEKIIEVMNKMYESTRIFRIFYNEVMNVTRNPNPNWVH
jgi:hypothetical protein